MAFSWRSRTALVALVAVVAAGPAAAQTDYDRVHHVVGRTSFGTEEGVIRGILLGPGTLDAKLGKYIDDHLDGLIVENANLGTWLGQLSIANGAQGTPGTQADLQKSILLRAVVSTRQLREMMANFWERHFNNTFHTTEGYLTNFGGLTDPEESFATWFEREENDYFRSHAFGDFRDLVDYNAKGVPMLIYLNGVSNKKNAVNENYARELLELHAMGPASIYTGALNYTQADIVSVAQILTGWKIVYTAGPPKAFTVGSDDLQHETFSGPLFPPNLGVQFVFSSTGSVVADTDALLDHLVQRDATKDFVVRKLVAFFYGDEQAVATTGRIQQTIDAAKAVWGPRGDIRAVLRVLLKDAFLLRALNRFGKVMSPVESIARPMRTLGAMSVPVGSDAPTALFFAHESMKTTREYLFGFPSPDGYPTDSEEQLGTQTFFDRLAWPRQMYDILDAGYTVLAPFHMDFGLALLTLKAQLGTGWTDSTLVANTLIKRFFGTVVQAGEQAAVIQVLDSNPDGSSSPLSGVNDDFTWAKRVTAAVTLIVALPRGTMK